MLTWTWCHAYCLCCLTAVREHACPVSKCIIQSLWHSCNTDMACLRSCSDMLRLEGCAVSQTGREHQRRGQGCEDVIHWEVPLRSCGNNASLFCIFDGHCGRNSAREARELLPQILSDSLKQVDDSLQHGSGADNIWEQTFLSTDSSIKRAALQQHSWYGRMGKTMSAYKRLMSGILQWCSVMAHTWKECS